MSYWSGRVGPCWWSYFEGQITQSDWNSFLHFSRQSYTIASAGDVILTVPFRATAPPLAMRRQLGSLIDETANTNPITHHAFATDSSLVLMVNTAINWLSTKPYRERTFIRPTDALRWLGGVNRRVRPDEVRRAIAAAVPASRLWPLLAPDVSRPGASL